MTLYAGSVSGSAATTGGRVSLSTGYSSTSTSGGMALRTANAGAVGASGGIVMSTGQAGNGVRCVPMKVVCPILLLNLFCYFLSSGSIYFGTGNANPASGLVSISTGIATGGSRYLSSAFCVHGIVRIFYLPAWNSGSVFISSGKSVGGAGGAVYVSVGSGNTGAGGQLVLSAGTAAAATGGEVSWKISTILLTIS